MRALRGSLPTEGDMNQTRLQISSLSAQENVLEPLLRGTFHEQLKSAENQLRMIRAEMADPRLKIGSKTGELRRLIDRHWNKLSATLIRVGAYCA